MIKCPVDFLIVKLDSAFQDTIITPGGVTLHKFTGLTPEWDVTCTGRVISVPNRLSKKHEYKGVEIEGQGGDEVIFSYMVVFDMDLQDRDTPVHHNLFYHEGEFYWKCEYLHVLGFIREGKIVPANNYVFIEEIVPDGAQLMSNGLWMPDMTAKEAPKGRGKVVGVGKAKKGDPELSIKEGDEVFFSHKYACKYEIHGKKYFVLTHDRMLAKQV